MDGGPKRAINKMESVLAAASLYTTPPPAPPPSPLQTLEQWWDVGFYEADQDDEPLRL